MRSPSDQTVARSEKEGRAKPHRHAGAGRNGGVEAAALIGGRGRRELVRRCRIGAWPDRREYQSVAGIADHAVQARTGPQRQVEPGDPPRAVCVDSNPPSMPRMSIAPARPRKGPSSALKRCIDPSPGTGAGCSAAAYKGKASDGMRRSSGRRAKAALLHMSKASGSAEADGAWRIPLRMRPSAVSRTWSRLTRGAHVGIAHQNDRPAAPRPGEDLEPVLVVVIVRALALRCVAPGSADMACRKRVLEKEQRKGLVGQGGAGQGLMLRRRERLAGEARCLLQCAQVERSVDPDRVQLRARADRQLRITRCVDVAPRSREQEVGIVGAGTGGVGRAGALQPDVRCAQGVQPFGAQRLALHAAAQIGNQAVGVRVAHGRLRGRHDADAGEIDPQLRGDVRDAEVHPDRSTVSSMSLLEQERSPAIATMAAQSIQAGATPWAVSAPCSHRRGSGPIRASFQSQSKTAPRSVSNRCPHCTAMSRCSG